MLIRIYVMDEENHNFMEPARWTSDIADFEPAPTEMKRDHVLSHDWALAWFDDTKKTIAMLMEDYVHILLIFSL